MILMTDAEPSIRALAEAAGKEWGKECQIQVAPRESHASNGAARKGLSLSWRGTGNPRPPSGVQTWEACLNGRQVADRLSPSQTVGPFVGLPEKFLWKRQPQRSAPADPMSRSWKVSGGFSVPDARCITFGNHVQSSRGGIANVT